MSHHSMVKSESNISKPFKEIDVIKLEQSKLYKNVKKMKLQHDLLDKLKILDLQTNLKNIPKSSILIKLHFIDNTEFKQNIIFILKNDNLKIKELFKSFKIYNEKFVTLIKEDLSTIHRLLMIIKSYVIPELKMDLTYLKSIYLYVLLGNQTYHNINLAKDILVNKQQYNKSKSISISKSKSSSKSSSRTKNNTKFKSKTKSRYNTKSKPMPMPMPFTNVTSGRVSLRAFGKGKQQQNKKKKTILKKRKINKLTIKSSKNINKTRLSGGFRFEKCSKCDNTAIEGYTYGVGIHKVTPGILCGGVLSYEIQNSPKRLNKLLADLNISSIVSMMPYTDYLMEDGDPSEQFMYTDGDPDSPIPFNSDKVSDREYLNKFINREYLIYEESEETLLRRVNANINYILLPYFDCSIIDTSLLYDTIKNITQIPERDGNTYIHCLAGQGRSGHIVILLLLYNYIKDNDIIDIYDISNLYDSDSDKSVIFIYNKLRDILIKQYCISSANEVLPDLTNTFSDDVEVIIIRFNQILLWIHILNRHLKNNENIKYPQVIRLHELCNTNLGDIYNKFTNKDNPIIIYEDWTNPY